MQILDLVNQCGSSNIPGTEVEVFVAAMEDVLLIPAVLGGVTPGDNLRINGDITLKPNKFFARFVIISDTGEVKDAQQGSVGSKSFSSTFDFKLQNIDAPVAQWVEERANGCFIALVKTKQGHVRLLGNTGIPVTQETAEGTTGMASDSERVWTVQWKSSTGRPALYYTGVIDVDPLT